MLLVELFDRQKTSMKRELKNAILDVLTPLSAHGAKQVPIQQVIDDLRSLDLGIDIGPETIKDCVDPNKIPFVTDIDDTMIYLNGSSAQENEPEEMTDPEPPVDPVKNSAKKQAPKEINPELSSKVRPTL